MLRGNVSNELLESLTREMCIIKDFLVLRDLLKILENDIGNMQKFVIHRPKSFHFLFENVTNSRYHSETVYTGRRIYSLF